MFASSFGTGQVLWSIFWFFLFFIWIIILFQVFADIFRSSDLSGWGKAIWSIFVILVPYLGVFVYLIARGHKMSDHALERAQANNAAAQDYIRSAAGSATAADELAKLSELKANGTLTEEEFAAAKANVLAGS